MNSLIIPPNYKSPLNLKQTEQAIKLIKDSFERNITSELRLRRVTAPLFVLKGTGINDDLNGTERKVTFPVKALGDQQAEVVNSLAKWKRMALAEYEIAPGYGVLTDMNAIRPDEDLDNLHSIYVDQWDWERSITAENRNIDFLKTIVRKIYEVLKRTEFIVSENYPQIQQVLPEEITFIHSEDLLKLYPNKTPKEREAEVCKQHKAVFVIGIGSVLANGEKHDGRAPDYDDWSTPTGDGHVGLNGDILLWNDVLGIPYEISSMGIRVDAKAMEAQLRIEHAEDRKNLLFHKKLLNGELPLSIGGGIGQSRICMYLLRKAHIGEVQSSLWDEETKQGCKKHNIQLI
ncbi:MAG: aspartate--ammonia ligase [Bacteroidales bacterium]|jgi:aspartate--ammonia ligase|nr:aspartate--ammonia ligase [Bacteroidales bacterium]